jgi:hypothetical protein
MQSPLQSEAAVHIAPELELEAVRPPAPPPVPWSPEVWKAQPLGVALIAATKSKASAPAPMAVRSRAVILP